MPRQITRRRMMRSTVLAGVWLAGRGARGASSSPNERLGVACIGAGGRGAVNLEAVRGENVVALCDVDEKRAGDAFERFPKADAFLRRQYRKGWSLAAT